ncbi:cupin domain-containing protein [Seongchinamella unica]|uniref:Cupin domain-containing protein n=1 Tax=Seongchinamella unica TaxID=2547392 RepID=A0A4R5LQ96_9GAMM|nr:cupin domain-containing protein [Seongchinamella unica]TDG12586.1 cupin domain-containing protein [Seongchinamella unica]
MKNILEAIPATLAQELFEDIVSSDQVRIERIVSRGHSSPAQGWYDQAQSEWVMVVRGRAVIAYPDKPPITLGEGDYVTIAAHEKHRVEWTAPDEDTIWLAVHY